MKNSKKLTTITLVLFAMFSLTLTSSAKANSLFHNDKPIEVKAAVYMSLSEALSNNWIAQAMSDQLTSDFLKGKERLEFYTARIVLFNTIIYITGSLEQWGYYFKMMGTNTDPVFVKRLDHE